jgi:hypothetical protein
MDDFIPSTYRPFDVVNIKRFDNLIKTMASKLRSDEVTDTQLRSFADLLCGREMDGLWDNAVGLITELRY